MPRNFLLFDGRKPTILDALRKLNEISVITVALYVLLSFQGIPFNCPVDQFQYCYTEFFNASAAGGESGNFLEHGITECGALRERCFDGLVERYTGKFKPIVPEFRALNPVYFQFCYCLMKVNSFDEVETSAHPATARNVSRRVNFYNLTQNNVDTGSEPSRNCNNSLLYVTMAVFFTALFLVIVGEILIPRIFTVFVLLFCALGFYTATLASLYVAQSVCPGATYLQTVDTVRNLIIACGAMLLIALVFDSFVLFQRRKENHKRSLRAIIQYEDEDDPSLSSAPQQRQSVNVPLQSINP